MYKEHTLQFRQGLGDDREFEDILWPGYAGAVLHRPTDLRAGIAAFQFE
jgi:hypothetical protein